MEWLDLTALGQIVAILFGTFGLAAFCLFRSIDEWPRRLCAAILSATVVSSAFWLLEYAAKQNHADMSLYRALHFLVFASSPIPPLLFTAYFLHFCGEDWKKSPLMYLQGALTGVLISVQFLVEYIRGTGILPNYRIDIGPWGIFCLLLILALTAALLIALIRRRKKLSFAEFAMFLVCFLSSSCVQTICMELMLVIGLDKRCRSQTEEIERQKMRAAVLQMRPHFIHNTMMTIYSLCAQDPRKARQVTLDFSTYLQDNFSAIAEEDTIPFEKELEHTKAYLAVELTRFEGELFVDFDTPVTFFRLPPLTLQPLVENAVKHGIDPSLGPLHIFVATQDAGDGVRITVEDTGPGFAPQDGAGPHIALNNIRARLRTLCGGTLEIAPRKEGGTRVTVFVPYRRPARAAATNSDRQDGPVIS